MMSSVEREIIEKFRQLDKDAQQRVRAQIDRAAEETDQTAFDYDAWFAEIEAAQITLRPDAYGHIPSTSELVNEVREERDADILHSIGFRDSASDRSD